jgi:hypothetical protein
MTPGGFSASIRVVLPVHILVTAPFILLILSSTPCCLDTDSVFKNKLKSEGNALYISVYEFETG